MSKKTDTKSTQQENVSQEIVNLVVSRIEAMPPNVELSVGQGGDYTKEQLIDSVRKQDDIGRQMIDVQMEYLRSLGKGISNA